MTDPQAAKLGRIMEACHDTVTTRPLFPDPVLSPERRQTLRAATAIINGVHPLTGGPLHPHWSGDVDPPTPAARFNRPFACGSCVFLVTVTIGASKKQLRCGFGGGARMTMGRATRVMRWWPGCQDYEPEKAG